MQENELSTENVISWSGSFPQNYEDNLKFIFGPYAEDLAGRVKLPAGKLLELACGTGQVTQRLASQVPSAVTILATDLSPEMMEIAKKKVNAPNVEWDDVDMCNIPYDNDSYDLVVCQFGAMFASDKRKAFDEILRILKPGGRLLFNTWGLLSNNKVFELFNETLVKVINVDLAGLEQGPFSMQDQRVTRQLLEKVGYQSIQVDKVCFTGQSPTSAQAAKGFFQGSQLASNLKANNPGLGEKIQIMVADAFTKQLGDRPLRSPLEAWVFSATK